MTSPQDLIEWMDRVETHIDHVRTLTELGYEPRACRVAYRELELELWTFRSHLPEDERERLEWLEANREMPS